MEKFIVAAENDNGRYVYFEVSAPSEETATQMAETALGESYCGIDCMGLADPKRNPNVSFHMWQNAQILHPVVDIPEDPTLPDFGQPATW
jgi:hypothetical protein